MEYYQRNVNYFRSSWGKWGGGINLEQQDKQLQPRLGRRWELL